MTRADAIKMLSEFYPDEASDLIPEWIQETEAESMPEGADPSLADTFWLGWGIQDVMNGYDLYRLKIGEGEDNDPLDKLAEINRRVKALQEDADQSEVESFLEWLESYTQG